MSLDFTLDTYKEILETLKSQGYIFQTYEEFSQNPIDGKVAILRHDVDRAPYNGVKMATIEYNLEIKASYYFRVVDESYNEHCIRSIVDLGHEFGYHYEDLTLAKGDKQLAFEQFKKNLEMFRKFYDIKTMCMHGSPATKWDNRHIWQDYDYKQFGIIAEPYFDLDFNKVFYITDASRTWNNEKVTLRDKVDSDFKIDINSSNDILSKINNNTMPNYIMLSTHPHNWAAGFPEWLKIKLWQGAKNQVKKIIVKRS